MDSNNYNIPYQMAVLMVGYFHHTITPQEHDKLDEWLEASEHIEVFEDCMEMTYRPRQPETDPDMDEEERELRYIIDLIVKHVKQSITKEEEKNTR